MINTVQLSKITSTRGIRGEPPRLCKLITRENGELKSAPGALLTHGTVERVEVTSVHELGALIDTLGADQALAFGVTEQASAPVLSTRELAKNPTPGAITRTNEHFKWSDGPGVMFLDYDPPKGERALSARELVDAIREAVPELGTVELLWRPNSSGCIFDEATGEQLRAVSGQHVYCIVERASDIPAMIKTIDERLWFYGHGRVVVSEAGRPLYRTLIDSSVAQPERLDFTRAACGPGLVQRMAPSQVFATVTEELMGVDQFAAVEPLESIDSPDAAELSSSVAAIKKAAENEPAIVQKITDAKTTHRLKLARERAKPGDDVEALAQTIGQQLDAGILSAEHAIKLQDGTALTVAEILENPARFDGKKCADPLEPGYGDRRTVGMIRTERYPPRITTMAHGGGVYYLFDVRADIMAMFEVVEDQTVANLRAMDPAAILATWVDMALHLQPLETKTMIDEVHRLTGKGKRDLNAALRAKRDALRSEKKAVSVARRTGDRKTIIHRPENATEQAAQVEALIVKNSPPGAYVQFAGLLSHVVTKRPRYAHQIDNPDNPAPPVLQIEPLNAVEILRRVEGEVVFVNVGSKGDQTPIGVPGPIQNILRDKTDHAAPQVTGVATHPIVSRDGGILSADGLDLETGLFLVGAAVPGVRAFERSEAVHALARLRAALGDGFEFASPLDLDIAVAALLTGLQRRTLDQAPGLAVLASTQSSGKTTMARLLHLLLTGQDLPVSPFNDDSDEAMTKRLLSTLIRNPVMVCFDNIKDGFTFRSAPVATAMTSAVFKDRLLGFSRDIECPTNTLFVLTGNNVSLGADEVTRWMICRLAPKAARPEKRTFTNPDVVARALEIRTAVLRDAVGIIAGYRTHAADSIRGCSRFAQWDKMIRQSLMWAGAEDVATVFDRNDAQSEENNAHRGLLMALQKEFQKRWFTSREVVTATSHSLDGSVLADCLEALRVSKTSDPRAVGHCLTSKVGRAATFNDGELVLNAMENTNTGIKRYRVAGMCGVI
jgi:hypothetical protein